MKRTSEKKSGEEIWEKEKEENYSTEKKFARETGRLATSIDFLSDD